MAPGSAGRPAARVGRALGGLAGQGPRFKSLWAAFAAQRGASRGEIRRGWRLPDGRPTLPLVRGLVLWPLLALLLAGCLPWQRRSAGPPPGLQGNREDPALSGDGRLLASVVDRGGRATLLLQEQPSGRLVPLPQLGRLQPHRSPSLSWNGRYVALLVQEGDRSQPVLLDRLTGQLRRLLTPPGFEPQRLSLSPDGQRLAMQLLQQGRSQVQVFDLSGLVEPDRPPGQPLRGGGPP